MVIRTQAVAEATGGRGRPKINFEQMPARFPEGTMDRIDRVLKDGETRADLVRDSVEATIVSRERVAERRRIAAEAKATREAEEKKAQAKAKRDAAKARKAAAVNGTPPAE